MNSDSSFSSYWRFRIKHFSPAWFGMIMGTSISGGILVNYPFPSFWLRGIGIAFWGTAVGLFLIYSLMTVLRLIMYPTEFRHSFLHPMQAMFWGCMPMGMCSIIATTIGIFGERAVWECYVMWWINLVLSIISAYVIVFIGFVKHKRAQPAGLNAVILLPVVALVVCSTTGSIIIEHLPVNWRLHMIVVTAVVWGNGELLAFMFTTVYLWRLLRHNMPAREAMISCFLPVGPLGQGAYGFLVNAINAEDYLAIHGFELFKELPVLRYIGSAVAMYMVGLATFFLVCAVTMCIYFRPRVFGVAWWGLSFPMGTYALATRELGVVLEMEGFKVMSAIVGTAVALVSFFLTFATFYYAIVKDNAISGLQAEMEMVFPPQLQDEELKPALGICSRDESGDRKV
ncbi:voltage-dependent anion channel [Lipomyces oligophaga]|uniref:voltage-dependent anion channel n=1 Tax=Lipomyces oligophaga TaxID=45792 RepID=UPI0034CF5678